MIQPEESCPCYSGKSYDECCRPFHEGGAAPTAVALMRSRYSGYALGKTDYIIATTHPENVEAKKKAWLRKSEIESFSQSTQFTGLDILDFETNEPTATVTFRAHLVQAGRDASFQEKSLFKKEGGRWLYHSGQKSA